MPVRPWQATQGGSAPHPVADAAASGNRRTICMSTTIATATGWANSGTGRQARPIRARLAPYGPVLLWDIGTIGRGVRLCCY